MRSQRNLLVEPLVQMLMGSGRTEAEARDYLAEVLRLERTGFSTRILRRLPEANYYHGIREQKTDGDTLLSSKKIRAIIEEEASR